MPSIPARSPTTAPTAKQATSQVIFNIDGKKTILYIGIAVPYFFTRRDYRFILYFRKQKI
jgi:hypothetical protein